MVKIKFEANLQKNARIFPTKKMHIYNKFRWNNGIDFSFAYLFFAYFPVLYFCYVESEQIFV